MLWHLDSHRFIAVYDMKATTLVFLILSSVFMMLVFILLQWIFNSV